MMPEKFVGILAELLYTAAAGISCAPAALAAKIGAPIRTNAQGN